MASDILRQSISQNLAETVVVKETQSLTKVSGVEPVTSSHCALDGPPSPNESKIKQKIIMSLILVFCFQQGVVTLL